MEDFIANQITPKRREDHTINRLVASTAQTRYLKQARSVPPAQPGQQADNLTNFHMPTEEGVDGA